VDNLVTSTSIALVSHCKSARHVWDVSDAQGWAVHKNVHHFIDHASTMLMDC